MIMNRQPDNVFPTCTNFMMTLLLAVTLLYFILIGKEKTSSNSPTRLSADKLNPSFELIVHPFLQLPDHEAEESREKWVSSDVNRRGQECSQLQWGVVVISGLSSLERN